MSCNNPIPLQTVADQVAALLSANYVDRDDPRISQGVFTEPSIRGVFILDPSAKLTFCELVQECAVIPPYGKTWVDRPIYPERILASYTEDGETKHKWVPIPSALGGINTPDNKPEITGDINPTTVDAQNIVIAQIVAVLAAYGLATDSRT